MGFPVVILGSWPAWGVTELKRQGLPSAVVGEGTEVFSAKRDLSRDGFEHSLNSYVSKPNVTRCYKPAMFTKLMLESIDWFKGQITGTYVMGQSMVSG